MSRPPVLSTNEPLILALDSGNTRLKAGFFKAGRLLAVRSISRDEPNLFPLLEVVDALQPVLALCLESASLESRIKELLREKHIPMKLFPGDIPWRLKSHYRTPETLGADRKAGCSGAQWRFPGYDVLVVDAGTCVTYDLISADGWHHGGAISPGLTMRARAMHAFTERLPNVQLDTFAPPLLGLDTRQCLQSGSLQGLAAEIDCYYLQCRRRWPQLRLLLSGGDACYLLPAIENRIFAEPNLNLYGLYHSFHLSLHAA